MTDDLDAAKQALRAEVRNRRQTRSDEQRERDADALADRLLELVERLDARSMSCYLSLPSEPGTDAFLQRAWSRGLSVLLPVSRQDGLLDWVAGHLELDTHTGTFGVPEPGGEVLGPIAVNDVDLMIVPAAAVDAGGMRLGWGRGYFDKTLSSMARRPPVYAVIYDSEMVERVPQDRHDQPVDGVVTPTRIVDLRR